MRLINLLPINNGDITICTEIFEFDLHNFGKFVKINYNLIFKVIKLYWEYPKLNISYKFRGSIDNKIDLDRNTNIILELTFREIKNFEISPSDVNYPDYEIQDLFEIRINNESQKGEFCEIEFEFQNSMLIKIITNEIELNILNIEDICKT